MKIPAVYFTDLQIDKYLNNSSKRSRIDDFVAVLHDVYEIAQKNEADYVLFGGDWHNTMGIVSVEALNAGMLAMQEILERHTGTRMYFITGNHDYATKRTLEQDAVHSMTPYEIAFPDHMLCIDNKVVKLHKDVYLAGIPYYEFREHYSTKLSEIVTKVQQIKKENPKAKVTLLIHQTPTGSSIPNMKTDTDVNDGRYEVFDLIMCGHIHQGEIITRKFILGGNPLHRDASDIDNDKGVYLIDLANPEDYQFISRGGKYPEFERIPSDEKIPDDESKLYVVTPPAKSEQMVQEELEVMEMFGNEVTPTSLLTNYWKSVDGKDKKLLATGLRLLETK